MSRKPELHFEHDSYRGSSLEASLGRPQSAPEVPQVERVPQKSDKRSEKLSRFFGVSTFQFPVVQETAKRTAQAETRATCADEPNRLHTRTKTAPGALAAEVQGKHPSVLREPLPSLGYGRISQLPPLPYTRELDFKHTILSGSPRANSAGRPKPQQHEALKPKPKPKPNSNLRPVSRYAPADQTNLARPVSYVRPEYPNPFPPALPRLKTQDLHNQSPYVSGPNAPVERYDMPLLYSSPVSASRLSANGSPFATPDAASSAPIKLQTVPSRHPQAQAPLSSDGRPLRPRPTPMQVPPLKTEHSHPYVPFSPNDSNEHRNFASAIRHPTPPQPSTGTAQPPRPAALYAHRASVPELHFGDPAVPLSPLRSHPITPTTPQLAEWPLEPPAILRPKVPRAVARPVTMVESTVHRPSPKQHLNGVARPIMMVESTVTPRSPSLDLQPPRASALHNSPQNRRYSFDSVATAQVFSVVRPHRGHKVDAAKKAEKGKKEGLRRKGTAYPSHPRKGQEEQQEGEEDEFAHMMQSGSWRSFSDA